MLLTGCTADNKHSFGRRTGKCPADMNQKLSRLKKPETAGEEHHLLTGSFINAVLEDSGDPFIQTMQIKSPFKGTSKSAMF